MKRDELNDLAAFVAVAEAGSFTRAAAKLDMSQSALSHAIQQLEERLGIRLLARTTRSVSATEAGRRLLRTLKPALSEIYAEIAGLSELRDKPAGTLRLTTVKHAAVSVLWPKLMGFMAEHPDVKVELSLDDGLTDIVAQNFDAGVRLGESVETDMIAVRISPDIRSAIVGSPDYFEAHPVPVTPRDLAKHQCINYRQRASGGLYAWEFEKDGQELTVRVEGSLIINDADMILQAALDGRGLATVFADQAAGLIASGKLISVLEDWCAPYPGFFLYYPSRRQTPPALTALVDALRHRS
ncbi:LysR family transcriptional regulator [Bosea sp. BH3]|uniref:LysR family transcriptional regulator n=1 Tax=Bosea sp. BH3 TaxID=2871701 RepID=UPI0021CB1B0D|nr:LysR family transcriptional regulator [Bosea sp. BH3]MCU4179686.1 LysR family transcriptional regulator [Bosea sp. BH3]